MRRSLRWMLVGTLALTVLALVWRPSRTAGVVAAVEPPLGPERLAAGSGGPPLPAVLEDLSLPAAQQDIFAGAPVAAPVVAVAPTPSPPPLQAAPPPPPMAPPTPPLQWRYLGGMVTPEGEALVLLSRGDETVAARPGLTLADGFVVQAVTAQAVKLIYPLSGASVDLPLPPPPSP